jgi:hypothetical protein
MASTAASGMRLISAFSRCQLYVAFFARSRDRPMEARR